MWFCSIECLWALLFWVKKTRSKRPKFELYMWGSHWLYELLRAIRACIAKGQPKAIYCIRGDKWSLTVYMNIFVGLVPTYNFPKLIFFSKSISCKRKINWYFKDIGLRSVLKFFMNKNKKYLIFLIIFYIPRKSNIKTF